LARLSSGAPKTLRPGAPPPAAEGEIDDLRRPVQWAVRITLAWRGGPEPEDDKPCRSQNCSHRRRPGRSRAAIRAAHDAQVAYDCISLGDLDWAHTNAITARAEAEAEAAENVVRAALSASHDGEGDQ